MKRAKAAKRSRKAAKKKRIKPDDKEAATTFVPAAIPKIDQTPVPAAPEPKPASSAPDQPQSTGPSSRSEAARRTAEGKFTKTVFNLIGGTECPRFAAITWKERDRFMEKPENSVVRERYETHLESVSK
jgi:hypothetical protein